MGETRQLDTQPCVGRPFLLSAVHKQSRASRGDRAGGLTQDSSGYFIHPLGSFTRLFTQAYLTQPRSLTPCSGRKRQLRRIPRHVFSIQVIRRIWRLIIRRRLTSLSLDSDKAADPLVLPIFAPPVLLPTALYTLTRPIERRNALLKKERDISARLEHPLIIQSLVMSRTNPSSPPHGSPLQVGGSPHGRGVGRPQQIEVVPPPFAC